MSRLSDRFSKMSEGDQYKVFPAPEEFMFWNGWSAKDIAKQGLVPYEVFVYGHFESKPLKKVRKFHKKPFSIGNVTISTGQEKLTQRLEVTARFTFNTPAEFDEAMEGLKEEYQIPVWRIKELKLANVSLGRDIKLKRFNPNGAGEQLYCEEIDGEFFLDIDAKDIRKVLASFQDDHVSCELEMKLTPHCKSKAVSKRNGKKKK